MAIYRADKAVMSFATEATQGGMPEGATDVSASGGSTAINLAAGYAAGSLSVVVDSASGFTVGKFIQIGNGSTTVESEVKRVEAVEGTTLYFDTPTAFFHPDNSTVKVITAVNDSDLDKFMTFTPGVYEGIDVPDPEMNVDPKYLLGTSSNRKQIHPH